MIDKVTIQKVAKIARLELNEQDIDKYLKELNEILKTFEIMNKINTDNVEPSFQPLQIEPDLREDNVGKCLTNEHALLNTPHKEKGFFKGPKIL